MGLAIFAYSKLVLDPKGDLIITKNTNWPERNLDFEPGKYNYKVEYSDFGMSYGTYNGFRNELCKLAGYHFLEGSFDNGALVASEGPFWELANFSDCSGFIGTTVSKKLYRDFRTNCLKAMNSLNKYDFQRYKELWKSFEVASDGGVVQFA